MNYSFWYDEVVWLVSSKSFSAIKDGVIFSLKPPLFGFFLFIWQKISSCEFFLRFPCLIFGLISILLTYQIAKVLFNKKTGLIAAFIVTFSPFHIYYCQELTHYSLTVCLSLCSMYFFIIGLQENERHCWTKYIIATVACIYTNYMCLFLLLTQALFFPIFYLKKKTLMKRYLFSQGIILLLTIPLASFFFGSISVIEKFGDIVYHWMPKGDWRYVVQTFNIFNLGYHSQTISRLAGMLIFVPLFLRGIWLNRKAKDKLLILLFWLWLPIISSILVAYFLRLHIYVHRNFIYSTASYYLLIASGLDKLSKKYLCCFLAAILLLSATSLHSYYQNIFFTPEEPYRSGVHLKQDHKAAAEYITSNFKEGDTVIHVCLSSDLPFFYYASKSQNTAIKNMLKDYYANKGHRIKEKDEIENFVAGHKRAWFVFSHWEPESLDSPVSNEKKIKSAFDQTYHLIASKGFEGISIYLYDLKNGGNEGSRVSGNFSKSF